MRKVLVVSIFLIISLIWGCCTKQKEVTNDKALNCKRYAVQQEKESYSAAVNDMRSIHSTVQQQWKQDLKTHEWHIVGDEGKLVQIGECAPAVQLPSTGPTGSGPVFVDPIPQPEGSMFTPTEEAIIATIRQNTLLTNVVASDHRAVLFGDNFTGTPAELHQCQNDMKKLALRLIKYKGFKTNEIFILFDQQCNRENYLSFGKWALADAKDNDCRFIGNSSHGAEDTLNGQLIDVIVTWDMVANNDWSPATEVNVDEWHNTLTVGVNTNLNWCLLDDSCHSGGAIKPLSKRSVRTISGPSFVVNRVSAAQQKLTTPTVTLGGSVGLACSDKQLSEEDDRGGLFIEAFCESWDAHPDWTFSALMKNSYNLIRSWGASQTPQYRGNGVNLPMFKSKGG